MPLTGRNIDTQQDDSTVKVLAHLAPCIIDTGDIGTSQATGGGDRPTICDIKVPQ
jgi:hypothetical protein